MANTTTITKALRAEGLPLELVRDQAGYHYFIFDTLDTEAANRSYETHSIQCYRFSAQTPEVWMEDGRAFIKDLEAKGLWPLEAAPEPVQPKSFAQVAADEGFDIPEHRVPDLVEALGKLLKKARRYGAEECGWTLSEPFLKVERHTRWDGSTDKVTRSYVTVRVTGPAPKVGEYRFLGRIEHTPNGNIVDMIPGEQLPELRYRDTRPECDHCHTVRDRKDTFLVEGPDGKLSQVGRSCLRDYMGTDTPSRVAWRFVFEREARGALDEERRSSGRMVVSVEEVLTLTQAAIRLWGWCSKAQAENSNDLTPTIDYVRSVIFKETAKSGEPTADRKRLEAAVAPGDWEKAKEVRGWAVNGGAGDSDYGHNLRLLCIPDEVEPRRAGFIASAVAAKARAEETELRRTREREMAKDSSWMGAVGERLAPVEVTFESSRETGGGQFGPSWLMKFRTEDGNILTWFSSRYFSLIPGERLQLEGTVKGHSSYKDAKETLLTRCKIKELV